MLESSTEKPNGPSLYSIKLPDVNRSGLEKTDITDANGTIPVYTEINKSSSALDGRKMEQVISLTDQLISARKQATRFIARSNG